MFCHSSHRIDCVEYTSPLDILCCCCVCLDDRKKHTLSDCQSSRLINTLFCTHLTHHIPNQPEDIAFFSSLFPLFFKLFISLDLLPTALMAFTQTILTRPTLLVSALVLTVGTVICYNYLSSECLKWVWVSCDLHGLIALYFVR